MDIHLIDGTYELFRHYFALPSQRDSAGEEVAALVGVLNSVLGMIRAGATHPGVATDHVIESFRNDLYPGYKTGEGIDPPLWRQFHPLEEALRAMGVVVWAMVDQEADDALAAAARRAAEDPAADRVIICTADKDLAQCVRGTRVVQLDRRRNLLMDEAGVRQKFGVGPESIPDFLALVGDSSDGYPGLRGWGRATAAAVLSRYPHLEQIPRDASQWDIPMRGAERLAASLRDQWEDVMLFRRLATLRTDAAVFDSIEDLRWRGPTAEFAPLCHELGVREMADAAMRLAGA